jgi:hypothetical protein
MKMKRSLALVLVIMLGAAGAALADRGDPQKQITPADQARAKTMLLRKADLPGYKATRTVDTDDDFYCRALDESDLTLTGEAESPDFVLGITFVSSLAQVYESVADANASWRRGTSKAGERCVRDEFGRQFVSQGLELISFKRTAFPRLADRSIAYRLVTTGQGVSVYVDIVVLQESRAQAALLFVSAPTPLAKAEQTRLARAVAGRMKTAMRGA